jgi:cytidylate kinase
MVITVSRQAESGSEEVIRLVAEETGLQVADRAILEQMAQHEGLPVAHLARFDEVVPGMLESLIAEWQTSVSQAVYLRRLVSTLLLLEHEDDVIIVGRGAAFVLTDPGTLHLRITAPLPCRVAALVAREGLPALVAERMLRRSDEARARFISQAFGADVESPYHYDLTVNTAELSATTAADVIVLAARQKATRRGQHAEVREDFAARVNRLRRSLRHPRVG